MRVITFLVAICSLAAAQTPETASLMPEVDDLEQSTCPKAMCNPGLDFSPGTCIYYASEESAYYIKSCSDRTDGRTYCPPYTHLANVTCVHPYDPFIGSFPGGPCTRDYDCSRDGNCDLTTKRCKGVASGGSCVSTMDCDPGLYCANSVCTNLLQESQECSDFHQCDYGFYCNRTYHLPGNCVEMYSLDAGNYVADCHFYTTKLCQSGNCIPVGYGGVGYCVAPVTSIRSSPQKCTVGRLNCIGLSGEDTLSSRCDCGINKNGDAYCRPFSGDPEGKKYLSSLKAWLHSSEIRTCNIAMKESYLCAKASGYKLADDFILTSEYFLNYPKYQNNDACVKEVLTREYWEAGVRLLMPILSIFLLVG